MGAASRTVSDTIATGPFRFRRCAFSSIASFSKPPRSQSLRTLEIKLNGTFNTVMRTSGVSLVIFFNLFAVSPAALLCFAINANVSHLHYNAYLESSDSFRTASLETLVARQKLLLGVLVMRIAKLGLRVQALIFILFFGGYGTANAQLQTEESVDPARTDESDQRRYTFT